MGFVRRSFRIADLATKSSQSMVALLQITAFALSATSMPKDIRVERWWWGDDKEATSTVKTAERTEVLWRMLQIAAHEDDLDEAKRNALLIPYVKNAGDNGCDFVAVVAKSEDEQVLGAGWMQRWTDPDSRGFAFMQENIPEIALGVDPEYQGQGIGSKILNGLISGAYEQENDWPGICLSVRSDNPAVRLYERLGFKIVQDSEKRNRVGTLSFNMVYWLLSPPGDDEQASV